MSEIVRRELAVVERRSGSGDDFVVTVAHSDPVHDLPNMDVSRYLTNPVVLWNHDSDVIPVGRTKALRRNDDGSWDADLEWNTDTELGRSVKKAFDKGFINAASIGFLPGENGQPPTMLEWSWVGIPADPHALRKSLDAVMHDIIRADDTQEAVMSNTEIEGVVKKALEEHIADKPTYEPDTLVSAIVEAVGPAIDQKIKERDEAVAAAAAAEKEKSDAQEELSRMAEDRADLLVATKGMLPDGFETKGASDRDILVAALGDRVDDAGNKSDDYLRARLDLETETRAQVGARSATMQAKTQTASAKTDDQHVNSITKAMQQTGAIGDMVSYIQQRGPITDGRKLER